METDTINNYIPARACAISLLCRRGSDFPCLRCLLARRDRCRLQKERQTILLHGEKVK